MNLRSLTLILSLVALLSTTALSQDRPAGPTRIAVIDSSRFGDEKAGITKLVNIYRQLDTEFRPDQILLKTLVDRYQALAKDIPDLQAKKEAKQGDPEVLQKQIDQKIADGQQLEIDIKRKQEDTKSRFERLEQQRTGPIIKEIGEALDAYAKKNNIDLLLDITKLDALLGLNRSIDVTEAFIKDFNAKGAAVPVK
jgi:Skp family chaperone for outer membrane proteins